jgi:hypothetical protein
LAVSCWLLAVDANQGLKSKSDENSRETKTVVCACSLQRPILAQYGPFSQLLICIVGYLAGTVVNISDPEGFDQEPAANS